MLRNLVQHTLTFQKMLDYYKHNLGVDIIKEKLSNSIAQKMGSKDLKLCPLCQRPLQTPKLKSGLVLNTDQNWILPQHITQFALKEQTDKKSKKKRFSNFSIFKKNKSSVEKNQGETDILKMAEHLCSDCCKLMAMFQFIEIDTYKLMTDHKLKQGIVYATIITHRKVHKLSTFIKCGKIEKMVKQDVIERNVFFKRLILSNYGIKIQKKSKDNLVYTSTPNTKYVQDLKSEFLVQDNQLMDLFTGKLLQKLVQALQLMEDHMSNGKC